MELDNKNEDLIKCMNEKVASKLSISEKSKQCSHECSRNENSALKLSLREIHMHGSQGCFKNKSNHYRKKNANITCYNYGRIGHISYLCHSTVKRILVPKGSHLLTNHQGPIKV